MNKQWYCPECGGKVVSRTIWWLTAKLNCESCEWTGYHWQVLKQEERDALADTTNLGGE